jgi:hypothetical protein
LGDRLAAFFGVAFLAAFFFVAIVLWLLATGAQPSPTSTTPAVGTHERGGV